MGRNGDRSYHASAYANIEVLGRRVEAGTRLNAAICLLKFAASPKLMQGPPNVILRSRCMNICNPQETPFGARILQVQ